MQWVIVAFSGHTHILFEHALYAILFHNLNYYRQMLKYFDLKFKK